MSYHIISNQHHTGSTRQYHKARKIKTSLYRGNKEIKLFLLGGTLFMEKSIDNLRNQEQTNKIPRVI